jgi:hypothetical protein
MMDSATSQGTFAACRMIALASLAALVAAGAGPSRAADCRGEAEYIGQLKENRSELQARRVAQNRRTEDSRVRRAQFLRYMAGRGCTLEGDTTDHCLLLRTKFFRLDGQWSSEVWKSRKLGEQVGALWRAIRDAERRFAACTVTERTAPNRAPPRGQAPRTAACKAATAFSRHPNQAIAGNNIEVLSRRTVGQCKQACLARPDCKSFDYGPKSQGCFLSDRNSASVRAGQAQFVGRPRGHTKWPYDYYERACF